ncbi:PAS domain-containing protein [bacterium]|nr:PAS domain-containing protein [bacterium]
MALHSELLQSKILGFRGLVYILIVSVLSILVDYVILDGARFGASDIFALASIIAFAQLVCLYLPNRASSYLALFCSDAVLITVLVRVSGASASPFLVLFPLLAGVGPVVFRSYYSYVLIGVCLLFSAVSIGWGVSIVAIWTAIVAVGFLSSYLMKLLQSSEVSLERSEVARRRLENLQKVILANIPSGLVSVDSEGCVIQVNTIGERILGISEEACLRRSVAELLPGLKIEDRLEQDPIRSREIVDYLSPEGKLLKLGYSTARLADPEDGHVLGTLLVFQDLTSVIKMEHELRMSEKLAAVGKLAAGIAHEIRNPLAGISGSAQLLSGSNSMGEEDSQLLRIIQRESTRLDGLITEFLEYVRPQESEVKPIDISVIAKESVESVKVNSKWIEMGATLRFEAPESPCMVEGLAGKVTQVLMNLIINAGQAGAKNVLVRVEEDGSVSVFDDGSGISVQNQARLFEPFFTTKDKGTGLGLAICYRIIEAMGGRIDVTSPAEDFCENGGSIFKVSFRRSK